MPNKNITLNYDPEIKHLFFSQAKLSLSLPAQSSVPPKYFLLFRLSPDLDFGTPIMIPLVIVGVNLKFEVVVSRSEKLSATFLFGVATTRHPYKPFFSFTQTFFFLDGMVCVDQKVV